MKKYNNISLIASTGVLIIAAANFINKVIFYLAVRKENLFTDKSKYYNWRFGRIFFTKRGCGSPVLLIHDLDSKSSDSEWKQVLNIFPEHTIYTVDLPGCGRSVKSRITYTSYFYVQFLRDFILNIIKEDTDVIVTGNSVPHVIMTANMYPELFHKIIFVNPAPLEQKNISSCIAGLKKLLYTSPVTGTLLYNHYHSLLKIRKTFTHYYYNEKNIKMKTLSIYHENCHIGGSAAKYLFASMQYGSTEINFTDALSKLTIPMLLLYGNRRDLIYTRAAYKSINNSINTKIIDNAALLPQFEKPIQFSLICKKWLE